ncbi:Tol biopolymer transporter periplasmic protein [Trichothermofontia sichuanensis B231]|uniref:TolB family protein n=1 Tax=Trichothermofontia sichuanensis TaxID=3045816 RepID=UPI0022485997|nr:Tol biopolymer transporter periplasmic protein [Trichothermofontia sichuanensis]UZQ55679.1 Tol biopolymer transporter periplasmic protein [Trichothermofontia sichuanensis B231]
MKRSLSLLLSLATSLAPLLGGCTGAGRLLSFPFDPVGGQSLNSLGSDLNPAVSGRYLAFASDRRGSQDIYLFDLTTRRLVDVPGLNALDMLASDPAVSEDGQTIVFTGSRQGRTGIYLYDRTTRQLRLLTSGLEAEVRSPTISADGRTIAFEAAINGQWDILIYDRNGRPLRVGELGP